MINTDKSQNTAEFIKQTQECGKEKGQKTAKNPAVTTI